MTQDGLTQAAFDALAAELDVIDVDAFDINAFDIDALDDDDAEIAAIAGPCDGLRVLYG